MVFDFFKDIFELALSVTMLFFLIHRYVRWRRPHLSPAVQEHRLIILLVLALILTGAKVSDSALTGASGPMDKAFLLFVHHHVPTAFVSVFEIITLSGSFNFLCPVLVVTTLLLLGFKRWFDFLLLAGSAICGALTVYGLKSLTGRERPALWETRWYWGTSFPSGHTLETACVGMALALCLGRIWPKQLRLFRISALVWLLLVGSSRLILGVHWPSDVLAAACIGLLLPVMIQFALRFWLGLEPTRTTSKEPAREN